MNRLVTAIIPAYNEEHTIADVVHPLVASSYIHQVIVISDGSTDQTARLAEEAGAIVFELPQKSGKGEAMLEGVRRTTDPLIAFFDADLIGLTQRHIDQLLLPVINGDRMMNIGIRDRGPLFTFLSHHLPLISGERVMDRHVFEHVPSEYFHGFMVEIALNYYCRIHHLSYGATNLSGLSIRRKYQKVSWPRAVVQYLVMSAEIVKAMVIVRLDGYGRKGIRKYEV